MQAGTAITDVRILYGSDTPPHPGFIKIDADLNYGAGGAYVYIEYTRDVRHGAPITDIQVFAGQGNLGSFPIQRGYLCLPDDLNKGISGEYIFLCYTRNTEFGQPVTDMTVVQAPDEHVYPPLGWVRVDQDCEEGAGGWHSYVCLWQ